MESKALVEALKDTVEALDYLLPPRTMANAMRFGSTTYNALADGRKALGFEPLRDMDKSGHSGEAIHFNMRDLGRQSNA